MKVGLELPPSRDLTLISHFKERLSRSDGKRLASKEALLLIKGADVIADLSHPEANVERIIGSVYKGRFKRSASVDTKADEIAIAGCAYWPNEEA